MRYITVNLEVIIYCNKSFSYERLIVSTARHMERYYYIWTRSRISDFLHLDAFNLSQHATQVQTLTGNSLIYIEIEMNLFCLQTVIYDSGRQQIIQYMSLTNKQRGKYVIILL